MRKPCVELRPVVEKVWAADAAPEAGPGDVDLERMLPASTSHLVVRSGSEPIEVFDHPPPGEAIGPAAPSAGLGLGFAVVGGARSECYVRRPAAAGTTVGAVLRPAAAKALLGVPASELVERHTRLDDLWGRVADELQERLAVAPGLDSQLGSFERALVGQLKRPLAMHPAIAEALEGFTAGTPVGQVVQGSGYSHRRFNELFARAVGLPPKLYCRVLRFERVLRTWEREPGIPLADLALRCGYSDQAHLSREFHRLAGLTPGAYRAAGRLGSRHVPMSGSGATSSGGRGGGFNFVQDAARLQGGGCRQLERQEDRR